MPAKSPEAKERKRANRMLKDRAKAAAKRAAAGGNPSNSPHRKQYVGPAHGLTKTGLRAMLADAAQNTVTDVDRD